MQEHSHLKFKVRRLVLDGATGKNALQSIHFPTYVSEMIKKIRSGRKCIIDLDNQCIRYKQTLNHSADNDVEDDGDSQDAAVESVGKIDNDNNDSTAMRNVMVAAMDIIDEETRRGEDFISVMQAIVDGTLDPKNIALQLVLDIGKFLSDQAVYNMR